MRPSGRQVNDLREVKITRNYTKHAEGSVLVEFGDTKVICTASVEARSTRVSSWSRSGLGNRRIRHAATQHRLSHDP